MTTVCRDGVLDERGIMATMDGTYADELVRRLLLDHPAADVHRESRGRVTITWAEQGQLEPLVLRTTETDLRMAVDALGRDCRDALWPTSREQDAGFNLSLVHLDETIATRQIHGPLVITGRGLRT